MMKTDYYRRHKNIVYTSYAWDGLTFATTGSRSAPLEISSLCNNTVLLQVLIEVSVTTTNICIRGCSNRALPLNLTAAYSLGHRFYPKGKVWLRCLSPARVLEIFQSQVDEGLARCVAIAAMHVFGRLDISGQVFERTRFGNGRTGHSSGARSIGQLFVQVGELLHVAARGTSSSNC
ncbi:uncharacterized protein PG986_003109 [Apiospora aurea]|uniref:Uncharacterized protein n=1 Tax=Apiospora aurea TaxID=335848 RepID=A0ABR1QQR7_9PEZI